MYLRNLKINRLKLLRDFKLSFVNPDGTPRMWTLIIGENGTGKTTILQAIALAAAGSLQVNTLGEAVVDVLRDRRAKEAMTIDVEFGFSESYHSDRRYPGVQEKPNKPPVLHSHVELAAPAPGRKGKPVERTALRATSKFVGRGWAKALGDPLTEARDAREKFWFVAAYGVFRSLPDADSETKLRNPAIDRLRPLFPRGGMMGTGFASHFGKSTAKAQLFSKVVKKALLLDPELLPAIKGVELRGQGGVGQAADFLERNRFEQEVGNTTMKVPAVSLSHGYQSTIAWISDLVGHIVLEADGKVEPQDMEGVVLIDEIDLYLHPRWQVSLIRSLRHVFPKIQFIATTHSPAALVGLRTDQDEIVRLALNPENGDVIQVDMREGEKDEPDPRFMTGSDIYRWYFGLEDLNPLAGQVRDYVAMASNPYRSDNDELQIEKLKKILTDAGVARIYQPVERVRE